MKTENIFFTGFNLANYFFLGCGKATSNEEIIKTVYENIYSKKTGCVGVVLDMKVLDIKSSVDNGNKSAYPVTVKIEHVRNDWFISGLKVCL